MPDRILILGGTAEARELATRLVGDGHDVTTSLAAVTQNPNLPPGHIRFGGFGGTEGLRHYLLASKFDRLIDATHPFAEIISYNAKQAVVGLPINYQRYERPPWLAGAGDYWIVAKDVAAAAAILPSQASVFLTIGRKAIAPFLSRADLSGVMRMIEPPSTALPPNWALILARPPQQLEAEVELLRTHRITHLVCKNSGGPVGHKLEAARMLKLPVVMIARPGQPN
jgi:precorrin-6A/cobalt-precorrin-6A reductase